MSDGRMFKLDFDPRVIGNKILAGRNQKNRNRRIYQENIP